MDIESRTERFARNLLAGNPNRTFNLRVTQGEDPEQAGSAFADLGCLVTSELHTPEVLTITIPLSPSPIRPSPYWTPSWAETIGPI